MKTRLCYVSNSSSSSWAVFGTCLGDISDVDREDLDFENKEYWMTGKCLPGGTDFMRLTKELYDLFKEHSEGLEYVYPQIWDVLLKKEEYGYAKIPDTLPEGTSVMMIQVDHHSTKDVESAKCIYEYEFRKAKEKKNNERKP